MSARYAGKYIFVLNCAFALILTFCYVPAVFSQSPTATPGQEPVQSQQGDASPGQSTNPFDTSAVPLPAFLPNAQAGKAIYIENCAPCHGEEGNSDGPVVGDLPNPPPLFSNPQTVQTKSPAEFFHVTKFGRIENLMPPWGNRLSDDEIWYAVAYAWYLHTSEAQIASGNETIEANLAGEADLSSLEQVFSDPSTLFLTQSELLSAQDSFEATWTQDLSELERASVADYLRSFTIVPPWGATYRAGDGVIRGEVRPAVNGDGAAISMANLPVTLNAYLQVDLIATFETETDENGMFRFENLSTAPNVLYLAESTYLDVPYRTDVVDLSAIVASELPSDANNSASPDSGIRAEAVVEIPVYETTTDTSALSYGRVNWVVDYAPGELIVGQILSIGNSGEQTVVANTGDNGAVAGTIELLLPEGANALQFQNGLLGERFIQSGNSVYDTLAVTPGLETHQIFMSYRLPLDENKISFEQPFLYPIETLNLLIADIPGVEVEISELSFVGAESVQNIPYLYYQGEGLAAQSLTLALSGLIAAGEDDPRAQVSASTNGTGTGGSAVAATPATPLLEPLIPAVVGSGLFILLAGLVLWPLRRGQDGSGEVLYETKQRLIREIAALDDRHAAGTISDTEWSQIRTRRKRELLKIAERTLSLEDAERLVSVPETGKGSNR